MENKYQFKLYYGNLVYDEDYCTGVWDDACCEDGHDDCQDGLDDCIDGYMCVAVDPEVEPNSTFPDQIAQYYKVVPDDAVLIQGNASLQLPDSIVQRIKVVAIKEYLGGGEKFGEYLADLNLCFLNTASEAVKPKIVKDYLENGIHGRLSSMYLKTYLAESTDLFGNKTDDAALIHVDYIFACNEPHAYCLSGTGLVRQGTDVKGHFQVDSSDVDSACKRLLWDMEENPDKYGAIIECGSMQVRLPDSLMQRIKADAVKEYIAAHQG